MVAVELAVDRDVAGAGPDADDLDLGCGFVDAYVDVVVAKGVDVGCVRWRCCCC